MGNSLFGEVGGLGSVIGDYNAIRNGSYARLMKKYYGEASGSSSRAHGSTKTSNVLDRILEERKHPQISEAASNTNQMLSNSVDSLKSSLSTLQNSSTYEDKEGGSTGRDKATEALKKYVSSYNDAVKSSKKSTMSNVSSNIAGIMKATSANSDALKEIGITVNNDGTLNLDKKKLETADLDTIKNVFSGNEALSYGSAVASRLNRASFYVQNNTAAAADSTSQTAVTTSNSTSLLSSIENLTSGKLFEMTTDANGKTVYNKDGISAEAKNFIKFYNATVGSAKNSSVSGVTSNLASMMQKTADNSSALSSIGITVGTDGKLSLNSDTFSGSDMGTVKDTFTKYASAIKTNASLLNYYSGTGNNSSTPYSANGTYTSASDLASSMFSTTT